MQEIAQNIFIETAFTGLTLGVISCQHGLVLIDAPFRLEDARTWRGSLLGLSGGVDRILVNLDAHVDRTLGVRVMDCIVVGHEKMAEVFHNRPVAFKSQVQETGAEWEIYEGVGSSRWIPPEITFSNNLFIHWGENPLELNYWPGSSAGAITIKIPGQNVIFIGDIVTPDQPPFLASANLPLWMENLQLLASKEYQGYLLVGGRGGLVTQEQVHAQLNYLTRVHSLLENLAEKHKTTDAVEKLIPELAAEFNGQRDRKVQYERRLNWGLKQYFTRHYLSPDSEIIDD